jgi:hypothetical protein
MMTSRRLLMSLCLGAAAVGTAAAVLVATQAAAAAGLTVVSNTLTGPGPSGIHTTFASCPSGTQVIGGGGQLLGPDHVRLDSYIPIVEGQSMLAWGIGAGNSVTTTLTTYAICASSVPGYEVVQTDYWAPPGWGFAEAFATCPAGKKVIGAGGNSLADPNFVFNGAVISGDLTWVLARAQRVVGAPLGGTAFVRAYAICAYPTVTMVRVAVTSGLHNRSGQSAVATCPAGTQLHGLGALADGGDVGLAAIRPVTVNGRQGGQALASRIVASDILWSVQVYLVCASSV